MGISTKKDVRTRQLALIEAKVGAREKALAGAGLTPAELARDAVLRGLKADLKQARKRLQAIDEAAAHVGKTREERKNAPAPKPAEKGGGKKGGDKAPKGEKAPKAEKGDKGEKAPKAEKGDKGEKAPKAEKPKKPEKE